MYESGRSLAFSTDTWRGENASMRKILYELLSTDRNEVSTKLEPFLSQNKAENMYLYLSKNINIYMKGE